MKNLIKSNGHRDAVKNWNQKNPRFILWTLWTVAVKALLLIAAPLATNAAGFNFNGGSSSGGGSFSGYVGYYQHRPVGTTVSESTIPVGINAFTVTLTATTDVDVELWNGNTLVVGWGGRIDSHQQVTGTFNGDTITWSGYNGIGGNLGKESITISGTSRNPYVMKVFGYQAGNYSVVYSFTPPGTGGNGSSGGSGSFEGYVGYYQHRTVGTTVKESTIPVGINAFTVTLTATTDVDVELWSGNTLVVGWGGRIDSHQQVTGTFNGDTIAWSGYNGIGGNPGKESITIYGTSRNTYVMKVFGYQAGNYSVVYSWGGQGQPQPPQIFQPVNGTITSPYGWRNDPLTGEWTFHMGIDFGVPEGTSVHAATSGKVARSYTSTGGFGEAVIINHGTDSAGNVIYTLYAHNSERKVFNGDSVSPGKVIALSGKTGRVTGPHVHYEIHVIPPGGPTPTQSSFFQQEYTVDPQTFHWPALSPPN